MTPPNVSLVFVMVCFWVTLWLVYKFLIQPTNRVLDERNSRIDTAQQQWAEKNQAFLDATGRLEEELAAAAKEASRVRESYRDRAQADRQTRLEAARRRADDELQGAVAGIEKDANAARTELRDLAGRLAGELATKVLGREVRS